VLLLISDDMAPCTGLSEVEAMGVNLSLRQGFHAQDVPEIQACFVVLLLLFQTVEEVGHEKKSAQMPIYLINNTVPPIEFQAHWEVVSF